MAKYATFKELFAWQKGMDLAEGVHRATGMLTPTNLYGIGTQLRRAAVSVPSNVAEGFSRRSRRAYRNHVAIALGSQAEVQTQLELLHRLSLLPKSVLQTLQDIAAEVGRLLNGLWRSLAPKASTAVCYSVVLFALLLGLGPVARGLAHGSLLP